MADEMQDVVIRLAFEQAMDKIELDTSEAQKELLALEKTLADIGDEGSEMASDLKSELDRVKQQFSDVGDSGEGALEELRRGFDQIQQEASDFLTELQEIEKVEQALGEASDAAFAAGESFKKAGAGALTLVRGAALLGFSADDDLAKFLQKVTLIQGAFDMFQGSLDTIEGLRTGLSKLRTQMESVAIAQAGLKTAGSFAMPGLLGLGRLLVPGGVVLAGLGGLATAYVLLKKRAEEAARANKQHEISLMDLAKQADATKRSLEEEIRQRSDPGEAISELDERIETEERRAKKLRADTIEQTSLLTQELQRDDRSMRPLGVGAGTAGPPAHFDPHAQERKIERQRAAAEQAWQAEIDSAEERERLLKEQEKHVERNHSLEMQSLQERRRRIQEQSGSTVAITNEIEQLAKSYEQHMSNLNRQIVSLLNAQDRAGDELKAIQMNRTAGVEVAP